MFGWLFLFYSKIPVFYLNKRLMPEELSPVSHCTVWGPRQWLTLTSPVIKKYSAQTFPGLTAHQK